MVHLRIVVPSHRAEHALDLLRETPSVVNLVYLERAAYKPEGDVILCDVTREDASEIVADLREMHVDRDGSITMEEIDSEISTAMEQARASGRHAAGDAVVWEEVEARTSENVEMSVTYLAFMALACLIAGTGILLDSPILIVGGMIVGPDFGPIAGLCVAIVQRRMRLARRSARALLVGFPVGITAAYLFALLVRAFDITPEGFKTDVHPLTRFISHPDEFSVIVAVFAGMAGVLSLTSTKSGALIGVLVSVTTIPAAANIGVAAAFQDWSEWRGAILQLAANLAGILVAGVVTLWAQQRLLRRRAVA